jgi:hypothetical protein
MWLSTLDRLDRRSLIIMRERALVPLLGQTSTPVVCLPSGVDMMSFELPTVRVALFVSNVGKNIHLLRVPGIKHVFIGHGDSDKEASFNPFSKVYDQVWVAGRAGRDRYLRAGVGVADAGVVEVGRPQLASIATWEGWTDDLQHSSLAPMGPAIIRTLLDRSPGVRVLYKPHPLTGTRDAKTGAAHQQIVAMLRADSRHQVITGARPTLYECFNECDALISDISSVVADFVASQKPYVVTNVGGLPEGEFRDRYPTAAAAYLLDRDCAALHEILNEIEKDGPDPLAGRRNELKTYLLGPDHPDALTRFGLALDRLIDGAEREHTPPAGVVDEHG